MLTVDDYQRIRQAYYRDGMSVRDIARTFHHGRDKIRAVLEEPEPHGYTRTKPPPAPKLAPFHAVIDQILADDEQAPRKQRHTMAQVHRRLVDEHGYTGGYDAVRRYIGSRHEPYRRTCLALEHDPGERLECDFGHIVCDFPDGRHEVAIFACTWGYSNAPFALALPTERVEAVLAGMVAAFEFYGCVPREVWWDNPKTIVTAIGKGRERTYHPRYLALASWYCFQPWPCMPGQPQEKPRVENRVQDVQQRWATPVPQVADLAQLNQHLRDKCLAEHRRRITRQRQTIGERWLTEQAAAFPVPPRPFEPCIYVEAAADKYQHVRFDGNDYSVLAHAAFHEVTLKATIDEVVISRQGSEVGRHRRHYGHGALVEDPFHYLGRLHERPAALDKARVFRDWVLPAVYGRLRDALELRHGALPGKRHYIRVVQLLLEYPHELVHQTIAQHLARQGVLDAGVIRLEVERRVQRSSPAASAPWPEVQVPRPDLSRFDQLLNQGGTSDA